ncbi:MAG: hypothetical protein AMXMBFR59_29910 [Rhodanobacteraceae bacterium]
MHDDMHTFTTADFVGGDITLDLINTVTAREGESCDRLTNYDALLRWARTSQEFSVRELAALARLAAASPRRASAALTRTRTLREALWAASHALLRGREPAAGDLQRIHAAYAAAAAAARLARHEGRLVRCFSATGCGLDLVAHVVAMRAVTLLEQVELTRLRACDGPDCGWLFIDSSKSGRRRWCDMATCGNVAKARRFLQRRSETG